ncbi:MAG: GWxTD domain-containing protein [Gemmatimonadaceae bacterium]
MRSPGPRLSGAAALTALGISLMLSVALLAAASAPAAAQRPAGARSTHADSAIERADMLAGLGDTTSAIALLDQAVRIDARHAGAWHLRGMLAGQLARVRKRDSVVFQSPEYIKWMSMADSSLRLAAAFAPDSGRYLVDVGRLLATSVHRVTQRTALGYFDKSVSAAERVGDVVLVAEAADNAGMEYWRRYEPLADRRNLPIGITEGNFAQYMEEPRGIDNFIENQTIKFDSRLGEADYEKATALFVKAAAANPNNSRALRHHFMALIEHRRWDELRTTAEARLRTAAWDPWAWIARGLASTRLGDMHAAQLAFDSAVTFLAPADRERYARIARILRPADSVRLAAMPAAEREATVRMYWLASDPLTLTSPNEHWIEFLSRVAYSDLRWTSEELNVVGTETDAGGVHIRYGPPGTAFSLPQDGSGRVPVVWRYTNNWFLFNLYGSTPRLVQDFQEAFREQFTARPVSWDNVRLDQVVDSVTVQLSRFRAGRDSVDVAVYADIPTRGIARGLDVESGPVDMGFMAYDGAARPLVRDSSRQILRFRDADSTTLRAWRSRLPRTPFLYRVEAYQPASGRGARASSLAEVLPDSGFGMSDILVAEGASPAAGGPPLRWSDLFITPGVGRLRRGQTFSVVWETYQLAATPDSASRYRVEVGIRRTDRGKLASIVARILGGTTERAEARTGTAEDRVGIAFDRQARAGPIALDYLTLDLGTMPAGRYSLAITVTDSVSGRSTTREREIVILEEPRGRR